MNESLARLSTAWHISAIDVCHVLIAQKSHCVLRSLQNPGRKATSVSPNLDDSYLSMCLAELSRAWHISLPSQGKSPAATASDDAPQQPAGTADAASAMLPESEETDSSTIYIKNLAFATGGCSACCNMHSQWEDMCSESDVPTAHCL